MTFLEERDRLYDIALKNEGKSLLGDDFKREFFNLVSKVIVDMLNREDNFFGGFMIKVRREIDVELTYPLATIPTYSGFIMYFNPYLFLNYSEREMSALFKHEIYHMMYLHYIRIKDLKNKYSNEVISIAMDISINQFVKDMPMECYRLEGINREYNLDLKGNKSLEEYAEKIQRTLEKRILSSKDSEKDKSKREVDISKAHEKWEKIDLSEEAIKESVKKVALGLEGYNKPSEVEKLLSYFKEEGQISWEGILKKMIPTVKSGFNKTITRRDRRQPERMDLRGRLPNHIPEIIIALDISASMGQEEIKKVVIEIFGIVKGKRGKIKIIECDNQVRREYNLLSPKDIKPRSRKSGSTAFSPVFQYIKEKGYNNSIVIYFTDGVGERELKIKPLNKNILWVLTGREELSLKESYGVEIRINKEEKKEEKVYALDLVREITKDLNRETSSF